MTRIRLRRGRSGRAAAPAGDLPDAAPDLLLAPDPLRSPAPRPRLLRDDELQARLDDLGYVVVPWLEPSEVERLRALWARLRPPEAPTEVVSSINTNDAATNHEVEQVIHELFEPRARATFEGCTLSGASFVIKGVGDDSVLRPHQDWNNVDERVSASAMVWCPLVDTDARNGSLEVLARSHRIAQTLRGFGADSLHLDFTPELEPFLTRVDVAAGDAVIFVHNLFHGSRANRSGVERATAVAGLVPTDTERVAYWHRAGAAPDRWTKLLVEDDFYSAGVASLADDVLPEGATDLGEVRCSPLQAETVVAALRRLHAEG